MQSTPESNRSRRPTSVDVALAAGVSQATVSRALSGGAVSEATRKRVESVARRLGYSPNLVARGLVTNRSGMIGVVVADITNPFYPQLLEAIGNRLAELGRHMLLQNAATNSEEEAARLLVAQRVDGIIFTTATSDSVAVRELMERRFPLVLVNRVVVGHCDAVEGDNVAGTAAALDHLVILGHRRIGMLAGDARASTTRQRSRGFEQRLTELGVPLRLDLVRSTNFTYPDAYRAAVDLLSLDEPPTAIFCHNDLTAFAVINAARSLGVSVPQDLSVIGYDDIRESAWESYNLTTVKQPFHDMAAQAVDFLEGRIADPDLAPRHTLFDCPLIIRGTTASPPSGQHKRRGAIA
jgi:LacI family transcriptional regulator